MILKAYKDEAVRQEKLENETMNHVNIDELQESIQKADKNTNN